MVVVYCSADIERTGLMDTEVPEPDARFIAFAPLVFLAAYAAVRVAAPDLVSRLIKEDGVLEYAQVLLYGAAAGFALVVATRWRGQRLAWAFLLFAFACGLVAVEEISWGERLLGFDPPGAIRAHNTQDEMSFHNLAPLQRILHPAYILVGLVGGLGWRLATRLPAGRLGRELRLILPDRRTTLYFLSVAVFYIWMEVTGGPTTGWLRSQDQEVFETLLAAGFAVFAWTRWRSVSSAFRETSSR